MIKHPVAIIAAIAVFIVGAGTTTSVAMWSTTGAATASVAAGTLGIVQSGFDSPAAVTFTSTVLSTASVVTLKNTGSIPAPYTLTLSFAQPTSLAAGVDVRVVTVASATACTTAATATAASQKWTANVVLTGSAATALPVGASVYFCVSSTITQAQRFSLVNVTAKPTVTLAAGIGTWSITPTTSAMNLTVADTITPGKPVVSNPTDHGMTLTWTKPSDTAAITGYQVFRGTELLGTTTAQTTTFTDTTANVGTTYTYTIRAIDAAVPVDVSPASPETIASTSGVDPTHWYKVTNVGNGKCVDGENERTNSGTPLITYDCKTTGYANQSWKFSNPLGASTVTGKYAPNLGWDTSTGSGWNGTTTGALAELITLSGGNNNSQLWRIQSVNAANGTYRFQNGYGLCLDTSGVTTATNNTELEQATCRTGLASQTFTLTNVVFP
ncbi:ricin-type beta-trefoil lectin domain protein [Cryobacterium zhongshanensis]|uniref:RICIN domain-containing protein n=1 Tax=Cryobacterium zhongshanensis TaxID=2928153 RepID=A0AA41QRJ3_9MICO|nr:RICIN domain-containing protein [Cryobacterium zhongshanensis]MCI4656336.1 RICIN domain-containing protein [Cryobacterium zhongshanensis]